MALVRKILETTLTAESTSVVFTDSDIPNSLLRVYTTKSDLFPLSQTISGNKLTVNYEAQTSNVGVALEIVKQGLTINDTLTSDATDQALSAKQGKTLKTLIDGITVPGELTDLSDVDVTNIQDGQVLAWSDNDQKFINVNQSGGTSSLDDLSDVIITSAVDDQCLVYDNGDWVNKTVLSGDTVTISPSVLSGTKIADYSINSVSGSLYAPVSSEALSDLTDVTITSVQNGQILKYNSTSQKWENSTESAGGGSTITITTSDSTLYGETITLSDGTVTLSTTFSNSGEATFSGVTITGDLTAACGVEVITVSIPYFGNYDIDFDQSTTEVTLTIYSAKEDTISYIDIDGATQTITFASGATSKQVQITIEPNGSSITFTSSVAKNPDNLSQDYSKTFTITTSTTDIYLMPDAVKTLYWYGYESDNFEDVSTANGWTFSYTMQTPTHNANEIDLSTSSGSVTKGIGSKESINTNKIHGIVQSTGTSGNISLRSSKNFTTATSSLVTSLTTGLNHIQSTEQSSSGYMLLWGTDSQTLKCKALWYE